MLRLSVPSLAGLVAAGFVLFLWFLPSSSNALYGDHSATSQLWLSKSDSYSSASPQDRLMDVQNATLGFQKIFVINFPSRTDKRDQIALAAYLTGLKIEFIDAVNGSEVSPKAIPDKWPSHEVAGTLGCWRAHLNIYSKMLSEGITSALIIEDDADWDVNLKAQLTNVALGARYVSGARQNSHSPYGDSWELMSLGHCGVNNHEYAQESQAIQRRYWVMDDDPTVLPLQRRDGSRRPNLTPPELDGNRTRLVFNPYKFTCTQATALTLQGAARALQDQALGPLPQAIDMALSTMCKYHRWHEVLAVYPPLFGQYRPAGDGSKDSDRHTEAAHGSRPQAYVQNVAYPTRLNFDSLLRQSGKGIVAQHPSDAPYAELDLEAMEAFGKALPTGRPVLVAKEAFVVQNR